MFEKSRVTSCLFRFTDTSVSSLSFVEFCVTAVVAYVLLKKVFAGN